MTDENKNGWFTFDEMNIPFMKADTLYALYSSKKQGYVLVVKPEGEDMPLLADKREPVPSLLDFDYFQIFAGSVHPFPDEPVYRNTKTVVVVGMRSPSGVVLTRRADKATHGLLALPAGFQEESDPSWQHTAAREAFEETGLVIDPKHIMHCMTQTVENGKINLLFCYYIREVPEPAPREADDEVLEVVTTKVPVELAFEAHTRFLGMFLKVLDRNIAMFKPK